MSSKPVRIKRRRTTKKPARFRNDCTELCGDATAKAGLLLPGVKPLTPNQYQAVKDIVFPLEAEIMKLRARLSSTEKELRRYMAIAPGIDVELGCDALTADEVAARDRLYRTANELLSMKTPREMHDRVLQLTGQDARYYDAWRRQYFLQCLAGQRDYHKQACELRDMVVNL